MNWEQLLEDLEQGKVRAAQKNQQGEWIVNPEVKQGILEAFKAGELKEFSGAYQGFVDKHTLPPRSFSVGDGVRLVPGGSSVRKGAYVSSGVVIMPPAYVNVGAYIENGAMVDSNVLIGSCAQIGKKVHLSAGVQIGGVLEPIGARPVIIEDEAFIGAGAIIVEGIIVKCRAVIAPGVVLSKSIPIYDCVRERIIEDAIIPEGVVVVPGSRPIKNKWGLSQHLQLNCPIIIKYRDEGSEKSLSLEDALRNS